MKFDVNSEYLHNLVSIAECAVPKSKVAIMPSINNFLFELKENYLKITSTDLQTTIIAHGEVNGIEDGAVCIPSGLFSDTLKRMGNTAVTVSLNPESYTLTLKTSNGEYGMHCVQSDTFPETRIPTSQVSMTLKSSILATAIEKTDYSIANEKAKPPLRGMYCMFNDKGLSFVSTDILKLCLYTRKDGRAETECNFIISKKTLDIIRKILPKDEEIKVELNPKNVCFSFEGVEVISLLIADKYPNFAPAFPKGPHQEFIVDRLSFFNALERLTPFANDSSHKIVMRIKDSKLTIFAEDPDLSKNAYEELPCEINGSDTDLPFNSLVLTEMCKRINSDSIRIKYFDSNLNIIIEPVNENDGAEHVSIISPVKTNV